MNQHLRETSNTLLTQAQELLTATDESDLRAEQERLQQQTLLPEFWSRPDAQSIMLKLSGLQGKLEQISTVRQLTTDVQAALDLLEIEEEGTIETLEQELNSSLKRLEKATKNLELNQFLNGKYDPLGAILSLHAGQGGTEAQDWASMLQRMYQRYFERKGWKFSLVSESRGEEAGIKSVEYEVTAPYAYGYLKREAGTHRLVRQSPFNADNLRQTSFALVEVLPLIEAESTEVPVSEAELEWHFTRAGGAGGQNVNKVNTAVELTHLPTGIVVRCREERSQAQNKERALKILKAKLALIEEEKQAEELASVKGQHVHASWGNQIRNYVLHPYHLVKDTRTEVETSDTQGVLDGDIDQFILEEIKQL